ncbi:MAG: asparagine synthase B [Lachnospiraceae bacterium]|nr:asparagine synthase B [Lachnospiraceae bacterium]
MCAILTYAGDVNEVLFMEMLSRMKDRGPDMNRIKKIFGKRDTGDNEHPVGMMGFNRLSIMGPEPSGMQPFVHNGNVLICNGELYGFKYLKDYLCQLGEEFESDSDCEILLPLYEKLGTAVFSFLDAEFACVIYDAEKNSFIAARDPIGIRPLYYGKDKKGCMVFASEPSALVGVCEKISPFPPGHYYEEGRFVRYRDMTKVTKVTGGSPDEIVKGIRDRLIRGVEKRLSADVPVGFLLSGGLDSSLVCGIAAKRSDKPITTFAIGMDIDAIDLKYAREVADYIGSDHHEVIISKKDVTEALRPVIKALGTYDITTIRASIGMYLLCKWIKENTDIKVVLTGEISDELFGYKYTDFAPSAKAFQEEAAKRIRELHMYDVLRADRCISANSLEARVPFGDLDFVSYVMSIDPERKLNTYGIGKYLLRHAFDEDALIPGSILMREKAAFSDAVGHSLRDDLIEYAEGFYTDGEYEEKRKKYTHSMPFTKESLLYRDIFEEYYPGQSEMVTDFWMPNREWEGCNVNDPSARVLSNYGASGY